MIIVIECIVLCALFTLMVYIMSKNPIATLYNYPPKVQERVKSAVENMTGLTVAVVNIRIASVDMSDN